ncbi:phenoloxidase-activating factor 1-like [Panulirus ornatus]|uniref:phenoloxidase-activating factor 1-like n=1 Tax=Panulirus ornatus TaxID=150431 RepID=UPI003A881A48
MCTRHKLFILALLALAFTQGLAEVRYGDGLPGEECLMGGGVVGYCEEISSCLRTRGVVKREGVVQLCGARDHTVYVCCRRPDLVVRELCDAWSHYWRGSEGRCVVEKPLIVGGEDANLGEFPHTVFLGSKRWDDQVNYFCGGTLISPYHVLTAAHCVFGYREGTTYWAKLGEHDRFHSASGESIEVIHGPIPSSLYGAAELQANQPLTTTTTTTTTTATTTTTTTTTTAEPAQMAPVEQEIEVVDVQVYPHYPLRFYYHDVAVVRLKTPAKLTKRVLPACLPQDPYDDHQGKYLTVTGWGHTTGSQEMSRILQKVTVPVVDGLTCNYLLKNSYSVPMGITRDMLCAGDRAKDSCGGDSGGPLTGQVPRNGTRCEHTVLGVVSFGVGHVHSRCGLVGVYARVTSYLDWITGLIAPESSRGHEAFYTTTTTTTTTTTHSAVTNTTTYTIATSPPPPPPPLWEGLSSIRRSSSNEDPPFLEPNREYLEDFFGFVFPDE